MSSSRSSKSTTAASLTRGRQAKKPVGTTALTPKQVKPQPLNIVVTAPSTEGSSASTLLAQATGCKKTAKTTSGPKPSLTERPEAAGSALNSPTLSEILALLGTEESSVSAESLERDKSTHKPGDTKEKSLASEPLLRKAMAQAATASRPLTQGQERTERPAATGTLVRTDDEWSDLESVSVCSRRSSVLPSSGKRPGVSMDLATQRANELMLAGKEALEKAGNMKRESKIEALGCLQSLYELVLSISDSRSRHKVSLEQERTRAAKEIVRIERAHAKKVADLQGTISNRLVEFQNTLDETHKRTESVWGWLNFELDGPIKTIGGLQAQLSDLQAELSKKGDKPTKTQIPASANAHTEVLERIGTMRVELSNIQGSLNSLMRQAERGPTPSTSQIDPEASDTKCCHNSSTVELESLIKELLALQKDALVPKVDSPCPGPSSPPLNRNQIRDDFNEALQPIRSQLKSISVVLEDIKETKEAEKLEITYEHPVGLGTELALMEIKDKVTAIETALDKGNEPGTRPTFTSEMEFPPLRHTQATTPAPATQGAANLRSSYCEALMKPRFPIMVESVDPQHTSDDVVQDIKSKIDVVDLGIGVSGIRKIRHQKVVINCDTEEDRGKLTGAIRSASGLSATKPPVRRPLLRLIGVAHDLTNAKIEEAVVKQNRKLLQLNPAEGEPTVKVLRRTKGRNESRSNIVLEVSANVWNSLRDHEVRIGYQQVQAVDHSPIVQCYRCLGFAHMARDCKKNQVCGYCSGPHDTRECPNRNASPRCISCVTGKSLRDSHPAYSPECPEWQRWDRLARSAVSYL